LIEFIEFTDAELMAQRLADAESRADTNTVALYAAEERARHAEEKLDCCADMVEAAIHMTTAFPDYQAVADNPSGHGTATRNLFKTVDALDDLW
jgi:hypothetical protein